MNEEIMNYEEEMMDNEIACVEAEPEGSGISTGAAIAIGAGIAVAVTAVVKLGKKLIAKHRTKKELKAAEEHDFVDLTDEEVEEFKK